MDYVTRQFIFLAKKFRKELRKAQESLHRDLTRLSDRLTNLKDSVDEQRRSQEKSRDTDLGVAVTSLRTDIPIRVETQARHSEIEITWRIFKGTLEVAVAIAVVSYAVITYQVWIEQIDATNLASRQTRLSRQGLNDTAKHFVADQRPYVWITSDSSKVEWYEIDKNTSNGQILWTIRYMDYGKSPALHVRFVDKEMRIDKGKFKLSYGFFKPPADKTPPLAPTESGYATVVSEPGISNKQFSRFMGMDGGVEIRVVIEYTDFNGGRYEKHYLSH